jgi:hypothetical protein
MTFCSGLRVSGSRSVDRTQFNLILGIPSRVCSHERPSCIDRLVYSGREIPTSSHQRPSARLGFAMSMWKRTCDMTSELSSNSSPGIIVAEEAVRVFAAVAATESSSSKVVKGTSR